jgi:hypothetical protein
MLAAPRTGLHRLRQRPWLVVLVYAVHLVAAFALAALAGSALEAAVGTTGFSDALAADFDIGLWTNVLEKAGPTIGLLFLNLLWVLPLMMLWKVIVSVGLIHALGGAADGSFWRGVKRHTGRGLLLALLFALPLVGWLVAVGVAGAVLNALGDGEVFFFWANLVVLPTLLIAGLAVLDLMHDCARIALVTGEAKTTRAWRSGMERPFRQGEISYVYLAWFAPAALLWIAPFFLDASVAGTTASGIWGLFAAQQITLLLRAAIVVGWLGNAVAFFEAQRERTSPAVPSQAEPVAAQSPSREAVTPPPEPDR